MARSRSISTRFWTTTSLRGIGPLTKLFLNYTLTGPQSHPSGLMKLAFDDAQDETELSREQIDVAIQEGIRRGFLRYDPDTRVLWVINRIRFEFPEKKIGLIMRKAVAQLVDELPNCAILMEFCRKYEDFGEPFATLARTLGGKGYGGAEEVRDTPTSGGYPYEEEKRRRGESREPEGEGGGEELREERGGAGERGERGEGGEPRPGVRPSLNGFAAFWEVYPQQEGKGKAEEAWQRHVVRRGVATETVLAGVEKWRGSQKWADGFVPMPATWLNQHRWEDTPVVVSPLSPAGRRTAAAGERLLNRVSQRVGGKPRDGPEAQRPLDLGDRKPDEETPP